MEADNKKALLNIAYYGTIVITIALAIIFMISMSERDVAMYQQVVYYIWAILLILTIIFDIVASKKHNFKFLIGLIVVGLTFLCIVTGIIVYASMSVDWLVPYFAMGRFAIVIGFSVVLTIMLIVIYSVGEKIIELDVARKNR